jgi:hypothetical protein
MEPTSLISGLEAVVKAVGFIVEHSKNGSPLYKKIYKDSVLTFQGTDTRGGLSPEYSEWYWIPENLEKNSKKFIFRDIYFYLPTQQNSKQVSWLQSILSKDTITLQDFSNWFELLEDASDVLFKNVHFFEKVVESRLFSIQPGTLNRYLHKHAYVVLFDNGQKISNAGMDKVRELGNAGLLASLTAAAGSPSFLHAPNGDFSKAHPDTIINYITWDGSNWTARFDGTRFVHAPNGDWARSKVDTIMNYVTLDGTKWTTRLEQRNFLHAPQGDFARAHSNDIIAYKSWGGSNWTARLVW